MAENGLNITKEERMPRGLQSVMAVPLLFILLAAAPTGAEQKVLVAIELGDETPAEYGGLVERELLSLDDVELIDDPSAADLRVNFVVTTPGQRGGEIDRFALSWLVRERVEATRYCEVVMELVAQCALLHGELGRSDEPCTPSNADESFDYDSVCRMVTQYWLVSTHELRTGLGGRELEAEVGRFVAWLDEEVPRDVRWMMGKLE